jgi:DNA repair protein RecN (Recombination protein N)
MLVSLRIKNLALVEDLSIEWGKGFNSITGETGAGKSILISALKLTLGERADKDWIRTGTDACTVEAVFETGRLSAVDGLLDELGLEPCQDSQLILKRVFSSAGGNRQFVNGSPATLQALRQIGELLVDMHGPHDHQSLLNRQTQLAILDRFAALEKIASAYRAEFNRRREIEERKAALVMDDREFHRQLDLLSHQVNEIETAALNRDEEERIEQEYKLAASGQKLLDLGGRAQAALSENEDSVIDSLAQVHRALRELSAIDPSVLALEEQSASLNEQLQDLSQTQTGFSFFPIGFP